MWVSVYNLLPVDDFVYGYYSDANERHFYDTYYRANLVQELTSLRLGYRGYPVSKGAANVIAFVLGGAIPLEMTCPPETDTSVYGHGQTVIRYMQHFQQCLDQDLEPSPGVVDGAKSVAVGVAAWESIRTGQPVKVFNDF